MNSFRSTMIQPHNSFTCRAKTPLYKNNNKNQRSSHSLNNNIKKMHSEKNDVSKARLCPSLHSLVRRQRLSHNSPNQDNHTTSITQYQKKLPILSENEQNLCKNTSTQLTFNNSKSASTNQLRYEFIPYILTILCILITIKKQNTTTNQQKQLNILEDQFKQIEVTQKSNNNSIRHILSQINKQNTTTQIQQEKSNLEKRELKKNSNKISELTTAVQSQTEQLEQINEKLQANSSRISLLSNEVYGDVRDQINNQSNQLADLDAKISSSITGKPYPLSPSYNQ